MALLTRTAAPTLEYVGGLSSDRSIQPTNTLPTDVEVTVHAQRLRDAIDHNFLSAHVHDSINELPRRRHNTPSSASQIAALLFPDFTQVKADIHYEIALTHARRVVRQRKELELIRQQPYKNDAIASETQVRYILNQYIQLLTKLYVGRMARSRA